MPVRYGLFGGSFDPIHNGHVAAAAAVREARGLDRVLLSPAPSPPHKPGGCVAPYADRLRMVEIALEGREGLVAFDGEGRRPGPSYTVDTVRELLSGAPGSEIELLVGADMLADLPTWRRARELVAMVQVVAFDRPGFDGEGARGRFLAAFPGGRLAFLEVGPQAIASSEIRRRLARGEGVGGELPAGVLAYIREKGLYRGG